MTSITGHACGFRAGRGEHAALHERVPVSNSATGQWQKSVE
jgi:hypothetical protein